MLSQPKRVASVSEWSPADSNVTLPNFASSHLYGRLFAQTALYNVSRLVSCSVNVMLPSLVQFPPGEIAVTV